MAARSPIGHDPVAINRDVPKVDGPADQVNGFLQDRWTSDKIASSGEADELQVLRRLSLALHLSLIHI